jgi:hypothetical protein
VNRIAGRVTLPAGRGDEARHPGGIEYREALPIKRVRDIYVPDLHIDRLNIKAMNSRQFSVLKIILYCVASHDTHAEN